MHSDYSPIVPARPWLRDGALYSYQFEDVYFSLDGGIEETRQVFLGGNGLPDRFAGKPGFTILELGFGSALNFLVTWAAWREHAPAGARLHYLSVEKHPLLREDLERVHGIWPEFAGLSRALREQYPLPMPGFHRLHLDTGRVTLTLLLGDAAEVLPELRAQVDAFYLDGFAPSRNPQMWTPQVFGELHRLAASEATAATYSVAGGVRAALSQAGFLVSKRPGFGRKREMLVAQAQKTEAASAVPSRAVVIGAGIAGASCAVALARRGIEVQLLDSSPQLAHGASGNPAALVRPFPGLDWGERSRFSWAAFGYAERHYRSAGTGWNGAGVLQLARDAVHAEKQLVSLERMPVPPALCRAVKPEEGAALCGAKVAASGLWLGEAGWVTGPEAVARMVEAAGEAIRMRCARSVSVSEHSDGGVLIRTDCGDVVETTCAILANGHEAAALLPDIALGLRPVRGQASLLAPGAAGLRAPVCQEGYVTPVLRGVHVVGATYDEESPELSARTDDDRANLARAQRMLPGAFGESHAVVGNWVGLRSVSRDRRPVLGALAPGLYACLALGSRGFTWAPLAGELIASMIAGDPWPVERSVAKAISPGRFAKDKDQSQRRE